MNDPRLGQEPERVTANFSSLSAALEQGRRHHWTADEERRPLQSPGCGDRQSRAIDGEPESGAGYDGPADEDKQPYDNMNRTITEMQQLLADIRKDPKKYLNLRMSIF